MRRLILLPLFFLPIILSAQSSWWKIYDDSVSIGYSVVETSDGNYTIASYEHANPGILKLDCRGEKIWFQQQAMTQINCVKETADKGYIVSGFQGVNSDQIVAIKTDSIGQMKWKFSYKREGVFGGGYCIIESQDGGYVVADSVLLKLDTTGQLVWLREYDGVGCYVSKIPDGGFIACGYQGDEWNRQLWILRTDSRGKIEWERLFGIANCTGYAVHQTSDGGYLVAATGSFPSSGTWGVLFLKVSSQGDSLWTRVYDDKGQDYCLSMEPTSDGNYIASGYTSSFGAGGTDAWLMKIDPQGNVKWKRYWASPWDDQVNCASQTSDGGYITTGSGSSFTKKTLSLLLIKTDAYGNLPIEISPSAILSPWKNYPIVTIKPKARFINMSSLRCNYDIYYHCAIVGFDSHEADRHDSVLVHGHDPWKAVDIEFPEWTSEYVSAYRATFWATGTGGHSFPSEPMSVTFYRKSDVEEPVTQPSPIFVMVKSLGPELVMRYSNYPSGFNAQIFDAAGRKIDEIHSSLTSGTVTWGEDQSPGVYFIRASQSEAKIQRVLLVK